MRFVLVAVYLAAVITACKCSERAKADVERADIPQQTTGVY